MPRALSLRVVGADHLNKDGSNRRFEIAMCDPGEPVALRPEPKNPVDPCAVMVISNRGIQLGYLQAERAQWFASMIKDGRSIEAIFQDIAPWGCSIRVAIDGAELSLPEPQSEAPDEPDFYPDELPPDDWTA